MHGYPQFSFWVLTALINHKPCKNTDRCISKQIPEETGMSRTRPKVGRTYAQQQKEALSLRPLVLIVQLLEIWDSLLICLES